MRDRKRLRPRKMPKQTRSAQTVEAILDAAAGVFGERGYGGGTTNHIAERAGVSIGSLYQYFPNKDAILAGLMERHVSDGRREMTVWIARASRDGQSPQLLVRGLIEIMVSDALIDPGLHRVLLEASLRSPSVLEQSREIVDGMVRIVESALTGMPGVRVPDPRLASLLATVTGFVLTHWFILQGREASERDRFVEELADMLTRYLFE